MRNYIYRAVLFMMSILLVAFTSCSKFDDINTNPDASTKASRSLLATKIILDMTGSNFGKPFYGSFLVSKHLAWAESPDGNQYNSFGRASFDSYSVIIDAQKMLELTPEQEIAPYNGLYHFTRAFKMLELTLSVGDVPFSEAFKGEEDLHKPIYDSQKQVFLAILDDLEIAHQEFSKGESFEGDPVYKGNPEQWKVATRAMQLKVLMHLSKRADDAELKVKERFQAYAGSDLMRGNSDNFQRSYSDNAKEYYPVYFTRLNHNPYAMLSSVLVDVLKETGDYRLMYFAKPAESQLKGGVSPSEFDAYLGVDPSEPFDNIKDWWGEGKFSNVNNRYTEYAPGEPIAKLSFAQQQFILAEAALRGWISDDPKTFYENGIRAAMEFVAENTSDNPDYHHNRVITSSHIDAVINNPNNSLNGDFEHDLEQVLKQKHVASFMQLEWEPYYDYRRTGLPDFPINPQTNQNTINTKMPMRWMYPSSEYGYNSDHVNDAVQRQWNGVDDVNQIMWILKD